MNEFVTNSMKLILSSLETPKTQKQILEETKLSPRTFRFAISRLKRSGLVREIVSFRDRRVKICKR